MNRISDNVPLANDDVFLMNTLTDAQLLVAPENPDAVLARIASPSTGWISATVTEKGYCLRGSGELDVTHPDIAHDPRHAKLTPRIALSHQTGFPNWRPRCAPRSRCAPNGQLAFLFDPGVTPRSVPTRFPIRSVMR